VKVHVIAHESPVSVRRAEAGLPVQDDDTGGMNVGQDHPASRADDAGELRDGLVEARQVGQSQRTDHQIELLIWEGKTLYRSPMKPRTGYTFPCHAQHLI
jgi:hypothetical protein